MRISHWLTRLQNRPVRSTRRRTPQQSAESLEPRTLLTTVGVPISPTELTIFVDDGDSVTVQRNATTGDVEVLDAAMQTVAAIPTFQASTLTALNIFAGDADNTIDVSALTTSEFPALTTIVIDSGDGDDVITGSDDFAELIDGGDGNDTITGNGGDDTIAAGDGDDVVTGGAGLDSILGGNGQDVIDGGTGNDNIDAGDGQDSVDGGDGDDVINAGDGLDTVNGGAGADFINGMSGTDLLNGDADNDTVFGGSENDVVNGGDGNDIVNGQAGNDTVSGDAGDDTAYGGGGRDVLFGGDGDDIVNGQSGNDTLDGGGGSDRAYGGSGNDSLNGRDGDDTLRGQSGNDTLSGESGMDSLAGGSGDDLIISGEAIEEAALTLSVSAPANVAEGNTGSSVMQFTVSLSGASTLPVTVFAETANGSASAGSDYTGFTGQLLTFAPGVLSQTIDVDVLADTADEIDETVRLILSNPTNSRLLTPEAIGTISDDDATVSELFATTLDGDLYIIDPATAQATFVGSMGVSDVHDVLGGAGFLRGFTGNGNQLFTTDVFTAETVLGPAVTGLPTGISEGDLVGGINAVFSGVGNPSLFQIDNVTGAATNVGGLTVGGNNLAQATDNVEVAYLAGFPTTFGVITGGVTGANATFNDALFTVDLATAALTRIGPLGIDLGPGPGGFYPDVRNDPRATGDFMLLDGATPSGNLYRVNISTGQATLIGATNVGNWSGLTRADNIPTAFPEFSVSDEVLTEIDTGTTLVTFTVNRSSSSLAGSVNYSTVDGTARSGSDYVGTSGILNFAAGQTSMQVQVAVNGDSTIESDEVFFLQLTNPSGGVIADGFGTATIITDELAALGDTMIGDSGNDTVIASSGDDFINGGTGSDSLSGGGGNDSIDGGDGDDTIDGGGGDDTIAGQNGDDVITAGAGIDTVVWNGLGNGGDVILASDGAETLIVQGDSGVNTYNVDSNSGLLRITEGAASITVATSTTTINVNGGSEADVITIGEIADVNPLVLNIDGQADNDTITAFDANIGDVRLFLNGGTGNDTITGSRDGDSINGDGGDDSVLGGLGNDSVDGGDGNDTLNGEAGNDFLLGNTGNDLMDGGEGDDLLTGGLGNDTAIGGLGNDSLFGGFGADVLNGNSGNDLADGGRDNDQVLGGSGNDSLKGGTGDDTIRGQSGSDLIKGGDGDDDIQGNSGNDIIDAGDGDDDVNAGNGNDIAVGGDGDDTLNGMSGADTLLGGNGADNQLGGAGIDSLYGGEGDDSLNGGSSTDQFNGGEGVDELVSPDAGEVDNNNLAIETSVMEALELLNGF